MQIQMATPKREKTKISQSEVQRLNALNKQCCSASKNECAIIATYDTR